MNIEKRKFASRKAGKSPWYEVEVRDGEVVITDDKDGSVDVDTAGASAKVPDHVDLPDQAAASDAEVIGYVVTESGDFLAIDNHQKVDEDLRAHLGWYYRESDTLVIAQFIDRLMA